MKTQLIVIKADTNVAFEAIHAFEEHMCERFGKANVVSLPWGITLTTLDVPAVTNAGQSPIDAE